MLLLLCPHGVKAYITIQWQWHCNGVYVLLILNVIFKNNHKTCHHVCIHCGFLSLHKGTKTRSCRVTLVNMEKDPLS